MCAIQSAVKWATRSLLAIRDSFDSYGLTVDQTSNSKLLEWNFRQLDCPDGLSVELSASLQMKTNRGPKALYSKRGKAIK
jgi:hypothetical protein